MRNSITSTTLCESIIVVNGVSMTQREYRKMLKERGLIKAKPKKKKESSEIQLDSLEVKELVKGVKLLSSLKAYHRNGYRQWGNIHTQIVGLNGIRQPFSQFNAKYWEIKDIMTKIENVGGKSEKAVYQYMEKLGYLLDDMIEIIKELSLGISRNDVCQVFKNEKAIFENGRRLGLKELMSRVCRTLIDMQSIVIKCDAYGKKGINPFEYTTKAFNGMMSCWCGNDR